MNKRTFIRFATAVMASPFVLSLLKRELNGFSDATDVGKLASDLKIDCRTDEENTCRPDLTIDRKRALEKIYLMSGFGVDRELHSEIVRLVSILAVEARTISAVLFVQKNLPIVLDTLAR